MTNRICLVVTGRLVATPEQEGDQFDAEAEIEAAFDRTMDELLKIQLFDPTVSGTNAGGEMELSVMVEGDDALARADSATRAALSAAGVRTATRDGIDRQVTFEWSETTARPVRA